MTREKNETGKERGRNGEKRGGFSGRMWGDECAQCLLACGMGVSTAVRGSADQQPAVRACIAD